MTTSAVEGLNGFGMTVPDLDVAQRFYTTFGLDVRRSDDGRALLCNSPGRSSNEIVLMQGEKKRLHHLSFRIAPTSVAGMTQRIEVAGIKVYPCAPDGWQREGLWFEDPWGTWIHLNPEDADALPCVEVPAFNFGGAANRVDINLWQTLEKDRPPLRIGHLLIFTPEWARAERFYSDVLGLRTTDRAAGKVAFMAAGQGVIDHHCFGLINSSHRGFQHASFQVPSFDDIGYGAWRMREAGYGDGFGPGRHAIASNLFHYVRDPWGSWVEFYADMDKITDRWLCRDWNDLPYTWGPRWSPEFWGKEMNANLEPS
ncbi:Manganese-dependent 2,3-dihydroxybiphenyl 1,2-dioxygenase [Pandoraea anapnoica]|uniref:Manganese-dependent 2,3-dihydroxybiphenyl 1,2-dioxygenase n=2 Tax=Pandoraea anapnoica TaxID=2508301 RepID=A0A5E5ARR4_9BURK|nr:Manganese-dependent 2,3-dihydroxybiphenyl 1,2-dioxygenase [Pandoraea anapnoica]